MRTLIVIPIIHTEQDMGSLLAPIRQQYIEQHGADKWHEHLDAIAGLWREIRRLIEALDLPGTSVRLYQDGLPVCDKEAQIVHEVAAQGSPNHQLLVDLMARGCQLMGTEDPHLLVQEYRLHQVALQDLMPGKVEQRKDFARRLLFDRDQFIGRRINETLAEGETGLLFLGLAHAVEPFLSPDIVLRHPLKALTNQQGKSE